MLNFIKERSCFIENKNMFAAFHYT